MLKLDKKTAKKLKLGTKAVSVGKATAQLPAGSSAVTVKLTAKARKALKTQAAKQLKTLKLALTVNCADAARNAASQTAKVTLKR